MEKSELNPEVIKSKIYKVRGFSVMLDKDLGDFYEEATKRINEVRKRNEEAFSGEAFQLTKEEYEDLQTTQGAVFSKFTGHYPWVYTERGAYKLSIHLNSKRAQLISDLILDAFFLVRDYFRANPTGELPREVNILRSQVQRAEKALKGQDVVINNYYGSVQIFNSTTSNTVVHNDLELIAKLFLLKENSPTPEIASAVENAASAVREKDKDKLKSSLEKINELMDAVSKTSQAYSILKPAAEMLTNWVLNLLW